MTLLDLHWETSFRIVAARIPRVAIFEEVARPADLDNVLAIEALANERLREVAQAIHLVPPEDRVVGPGTSFIMAPFAYRSRGRFSPGGVRGAYYAGDTLPTAIAEVAYRRTLFYGATNERPLVAEERVIEATIAARVADAQREANAGALLDPDAYGASHSFGDSVYAGGGDGVVYPSVRRRDGACVAIFRPRCVAHARTTKYLGLRWNGRAVDDVFEISSLTTTYSDEPGAR